MDTPVIVWFRDDLRLSDHPALAAVARAGRPLICLYILDEESAGLRHLGGATRWWLAGSLRALDADLRKLGQRLVLRRGKAADVVPSMAQEARAQTVYWNRRYDRPGMVVDEAVVAALKARGIGGGTFPGSLLVEPQKLTPNGPLRVFTPFYKRILALGALRAPQPAPTSLPPAPQAGGDTFEKWRLEPTKPDWAGGLRETWQPGEKAARQKLGDFLDAIGGYAEGRDRPDKPSTSRLSPHLRFGEISPLDIWHAARFAADQGRAPARDIEKFLSELGWREFSWHLLHHYPDLATVNLRRRFDDFPWRHDQVALRAWQRGETGYPIVDAGMRELWHTGWMHNRVRMVAASFLVKHLLIDWRAGERWFWDTLVDADPANNPASWQWVVGSGADAAPYFRIFNPVLQGQKFDPKGNYVRRWIPELAYLPDQVIHAPWEADQKTLEDAKVRLGADYPTPIVDHAAARQRALAAFASIKAT